MKNKQEIEKALECVRLKCDKETYSTIKEYMLETEKKFKELVYNYNLLQRLP